METIAFVMVNYNGGEMILETLASLFENTPVEQFKLWIVDNGSSDCSLKRIKKQYPMIEIIEAAENLGFGRGNNLALTEILASKKYKYVALLNPDLFFTDNWLAGLVETMESENKEGDRQVAALNPVIVYADKFDELEVTNTNSEIFLHHEDYRFLAPAVGDFAIKNQEITLAKKQFSKVLTDKYTVLLKTGHSRLTFEVYNESLRPFSLFIGGKRFRQMTLSTMLKKVSYKITKREKLKLRQYTVSTNELQFITKNTEIINSFGAGFRLGVTLPDNYLYGASLGDLPPKPQEVTSFHGACVLLRVEALQETGLFDPQYFMYYEESDLALRMKQLVYLILSIPDTKIYHRERGLRSDKTIEFMHTSQKIFQNKWQKYIAELVEPMQTTNSPN